MKLIPYENGNGYTMELSPIETSSWSIRPSATWPGSEISGSKLWVEVDSNGIVDYQVDGSYGDIPSHELEAIITDHLPVSLSHLWPVWGRELVVNLSEGGGV